ncbi:hypothetical protein V8E55_008134, partial [Tylopilus felleus]
GKIQSTINGLKMHHIDHWLFNITVDIHLCRRYAPTLEGPTPHMLVPFCVPGAQPPPNFTLPTYT